MRGKSIHNLERGEGNSYLQHFLQIFDKISMHFPLIIEKNMREQHIPNMQAIFFRKFDRLINKIMKHYLKSLLKYPGQNTRVTPVI